MEIEPFMDTMKSVKYPKVSTAGQGSAMPLREGRDYAERRNLELVAHHRNGSAATTLETQLRASIPGLTKLEHALKIAIAAAAGAEQFSHEIGCVVHFAPVDIRAIAIEVLINGSKNRPESTGNDGQS
jgi:hypothetical protein